MWQPNPNMPLYIGRSLHFPVNNLSAAAFSFIQINIKATFRRAATSWQTGIKVTQTSIPHECLIEILDEGESVNVVVRGPKDSITECQDLLHTCMNNIGQSLETLKCVSEIRRGYLSPKQIAELRVDPCHYTEQQMACAVNSTGDYVKAPGGVSDELCSFFMTGEEMAKLMQRDSQRGWDGIYFCVVVTEMHACYE